MSVFNWSQTAGSNGSADPAINFAEGQSPSSLNDSNRAMMAVLAKYFADITGAIVTGGTSTAFTVTSNSVFDTLAHMNGQPIAFSVHATNGATCTLNVDGLGAKPLRSSPGVELGAGTLVLGSPYVAVYNNSDAAFYLRGFYPNPFSVPLGMFAPHSSSTPPNSNFVLPYGQAISRTTYATYFAMISTTFGVGDGTTTFNIPDLRGRSIFGLDNMGGSTAGRITNAGSGIVGTTLGATGGAETVTLARANLPNVQLTVTGTTRPTVSGVPIIAPTVGAVASNVAGGALPVYGQGTFGTSDNTALDNGATASINGGVTQTAVNEMPPAMILPYILRVI